MPRIFGIKMLKAVVADINTIDEAQRPFYVKNDKDGKFYVNITPTDGYELDNVQGLKTALGAERNNVSVLKEQMKPYEGLDATLARTAIERVSAFGDITPDAAKTAIETATRLSALDPEKEADKIAQTKIDATVNPLKAQFQLRETELNTQITAATGTITSLTGQLEKLMRGNAIKTELAKLNPLDDARDAIEILAEASVKSKLVNGQLVVEVIDVNGNPRIKDHNGTPFTVADLMAEIKETRAGLFKPEEKRGFGTVPGNNGNPNDTGVKNPWTKEHRNVTQQMLLENTKPELAKRLKQEAGVD